MINSYLVQSAAVYGASFSIPIKETIDTSPITPYGESKLISEKVLIDTAKFNNNFKYIIFRYFNVAGASLDNTIGECHVPVTHLIPLAINASIDKTSNFVIYEDDYPTPDGSCIRDYVHVEDLASAHIQALNFLNTENTSEIFNCGYGHGFSVKEIVTSIKNLSGNDFKVKIAPRRKGDPAVLVSDNSKIKEKMNWSPKYDNLEIICQSALNWEKKKYDR